MTNTTENEKEEPKLVWNLSKRNLTEADVRELEKRLTYNRAGPINRCNVISNVEYLFSHASGIEKELIGFRNWDEDPDVFSTKETRVLEPKQLSFAADLKCATEKFFHQADKPDKGCSVVVLDRNEYIEKLEAILNDATKFKLLERDPKISRETSLTTLL